MNLYRSFGNLMEAWVTEGNQYSDSELLENNDEDSPIPSPDTRTNLCTESVDSGVETASSDTLFPATYNFVSTENAEIEVFLPEREGDGLTPASTSQSPVLSSPAPSSSSSSSLCFCPTRTQDGSTDLKVEQALQRTDSKHLKDKSEPITVEKVLRRRPRLSLPPKRHTLESVRGQRPQSFGLRRTVSPSVPIRQMSEVWRQQSSMSCETQRSEDFCEEERRGLSPGLCYLEHVCQMLEEIARQQMHNRALQMEMNALQEQDTQALYTCQSDSETAEKDLSSCQGLENTGNAEHSSSEPQQQKDPYRNFRQRSASDTTIATLHIRNLSADCRGQYLSTYDVLEAAEKKQGSRMQETNKTKKSWKLKIGSLRRDGSAKSQQMQSGEKNSARRRLSQLFRKRKKAP